MKLIIFAFALFVFIAVNAYPNAKTEDLDSPFTDDEGIETRKYKDAKRKNAKNKQGCPTTAPPPTCPCLVQGDGCSFDDVLNFF
jgi:hypothetical protein